MIYAATILVLFRDREITTEILSQYPPLCQQKQNGDDQSKCQKSLSDILSTGVARDQLNALIDDACSWAVEYAPGDCVPNQDFDDRLTLEPLGTDFIFTCPMRYWLQNHGQGKGSSNSPSLYYFVIGLGRTVWCSLIPKRLFCISIQNSNANRC